MQPYAVLVSHAKGNTSTVGVTRSSVRGGDGARTRVRIRDGAGVGARVWRQDGAWEESRNR